MCGFLIFGSAGGAESTRAKKTAPPARAKKGMAAQSATVGLDGAIVYDAPDFDAKVLIELQPGYKVVISRQTVPGRTGLGAFYRIKYDKNKLGFVADTDMIPEYQRNEAKKNPVFDQVENLREKAITGRKEISDTRYLGLSVARMKFSEKYAGRRLSSDLQMYGVRFSGPGVFFDGPPLDFNFSFSPQAPDYYQRVTGTPASGFVMMVDTMLLLTVYEWPNMIIQGGLGPLLSVTKFRIKEGFQYRDTQNTNIGVVGELGAAYRHKKILGRFDLKYHYENTSYLSYLFSLQHEYWVLA